MRMGRRRVFAGNCGIVSRVSSSLAMTAIGLLVSCGEGEPTGPLASTNLGSTSLGRAGAVIGEVTDISTTGCGAFAVRGWACQTGVASSIDVHVYARDTTGHGGVFVARGTANRHTEPAAVAQCGTSGVAHGFEVELTPRAIGSAISTIGEHAPLYVYGLRRTGKVKNAALKHSGKVTFPTLRQPGPVITVTAPRDGSADASPAINAAISRAASNHGRVYLPQGVYRIDQHLNLRSGVEVCGDGPTRTMLVKDRGDQSSVMNSQDTDGVVVRDLSIAVRGEHWSAGFHCMRFGGSASRVFIERARLEGCPFYGIGFQGPTSRGVDGVRISSVRIDRTGSDGIDFKQRSPGANTNIQLTNVCISNIGWNDDELDSSTGAVDLAGQNLKIRGLHYIQSQSEPGVSHYGIRFFGGERQVEGVSVRDYYMNGTSAHSAGRSILYAFFSTYGNPRATGIDVGPGCARGVRNLSNTGRLSSTCNSLAQDHGASHACTHLGGCGNGTCDPTENHVNCAADCPRLTCADGELYRGAHGTGCDHEYACWRPKESGPPGAMVSAESYGWAKWWVQCVVESNVQLLGCKDTEATLYPGTFGTPCQFGHSCWKRKSRFPRAGSMADGSRFGHPEWWAQCTSQSSIQL
jgi:hypothetical protein